MLLSVRLSQPIGQTEREERCVVVLFVDLDLFKAVNDTTTRWARSSATVC